MNNKLPVIKAVYTYYGKPYIDKRGKWQQTQMKRIANFEITNISLQTGTLRGRWMHDDGTYIIKNCNIKFTDIRENITINGFTLYAENLHELT